VAFQLERRRKRPVERVDVGAPVADAVRVEMVDRLVVVVGPPGRVTEALVADHLQVGVDQNEVRMTLFDAIGLPQSVPRPVVVFKPLHRLLYADNTTPYCPTQLTSLSVTLITLCYCYIPHKPVFFSQVFYFSLIVFV